MISSLPASVAAIENVVKASRVMYERSRHGNARGRSNHGAMRLLLDALPGWQARRSGDRTTISRGTFGSRIEALPLSRSPVDVSDVIALDPPVGIRVVHDDHHDDTETRTGWPMYVAHARLLGDDDRVHEVRIAAVYSMADHVGAAVARIYPDVLDADRADVFAMLRSARPSLWCDEVVCIAELWSMEDA